ncbi:MAG: right-handed parallel beta-helix repeat-containing protein, partial [Planctomycetes bacterium]|nr:right-handed parallel beta-helix repeat-containing protein [Planctomycetota bacterium]
MFTALLLLPVLSLLIQSPTTTVDKDNTVLDKSCTVKTGQAFIADADGNGVIQIATDGITVDFAGATMRGAPENAAPDTFEGFGVRITGKNVTLQNARIAGFRGGIYATGADGLTLINCDVSGNFAQHLKSTPAAEDGADWLWPHRNDDNEWLKNYGAGICVEDSKNVTIRNCRAGRGQNGLVLDHVSDSKVYDNDFSFLSGWGLAMWRCERNIISRNAIDFCVRGYSHGIYNRGQDSAGILFFEQNHDNLLIENSVTHGGDGFFGFAGREALGEDWKEKETERLRKETGKDKVDDLIKVTPELADKHKKRGNTGNKLIGNDFSYAPAHGIELTFSFDNVISGNRLVGNAICGIWGGYSQGTLICQNEFEANGEAGYGMERGGVNIEHGRDNAVISNTFKKNKVGVHFWWDNDAGLLTLPWAVANGAASEDNYVVSNTFDGDALVLNLRDSKKCYYADNRVTACGKEIDATPGSEPIRTVDTATLMKRCNVEAKAIGETHPVGARKELRGRDKIIITQWGPYDWQAPYLQPILLAGAEHSYRLLGNDALGNVAVSGEGVHVKADKQAKPPQIIVTADRPAAATAYALDVTTKSGLIRQTGVLLATEWKVTSFGWTKDPRKDEEGWRKESEEGEKYVTKALVLPFGGGGPSELSWTSQSVKDAKLPRDHFGTLADTELTVPQGDWQIVTESDDGIRVWLDDKLVIDDWTWHPPKKATADFTLAAEKKIKIRVEHFE